MYEKLSLGIDRLAPERNDIKLDKVITEFFADTHMKCSHTGNFQQVQCINETCTCVDEKTGQPVLNVKELLIENSIVEKANILYQPKEPEYIHWPVVVAYGAANRLVCCKLI